MTSTDIGGCKKMSDSPLTFQDMILALEHYWAHQGCTVMQPYDNEVGAGTFPYGDPFALAWATSVENMLSAALQASG